MTRNKFLAKMFTLLAAITLTTITLSHVAGQSSDTTGERAVALWEEAVQAKGGRERLASIQNFLITSTVDRQSERGGAAITETKRLYVMPGKAWIYTFTEVFGVSLDATVINNDRNFCFVTLSPAGRSVPQVSPCLPWTPVQYLIQDPFIYLMETKWVRPVPLSVRFEGKGKNQLDVIETRVGERKVDFYLHRTTRLPIKIVTQWIGGIAQATGPLGTMTLKLEKYVAIDGILMPRRVTRELDTGSKYPARVPRLDIEDARYEFNVAYNPSIFEGPASRKAKRDDWKTGAYRSRE